MQRTVHQPVSIFESIVKNLMFWQAPMLQYIITCRLYIIFDPVSTTTRKAQNIQDAINPTGGNTFSGPIGKAIEGEVWKRPVGKYRKIFVPDFPALPKKVLETMSGDARILYRLVYAVTTGT